MHFAKQIGGIIRPIENGLDLPFFISQSNIAIWIVEVTTIHGNFVTRKEFDSFDQAQAWTKAYWKIWKRSLMK